MLPKPVKEYLASHRDEHLAKLSELLAIPSIANVHDTPDSCQKAAAWLADYARGLGFVTEVVPISDDGEHDRPNVIAYSHAGDDLPTLMLYGHYDVQPAEPLELWRTSPFEATVRDGQVYARGAADDKGQLFAHLMALEAWKKTAGRLPVNVRLFFEGQEEVGSPHMGKFLAANAERLKCDAIMISDSEWFAPGIPTVIYSLRGILYFEVTFAGPSADLHSGSHGGAVTNPVNALAKLVAALHDANGRVTLDGFYDDVAPLTPAEREAWRGLPFDEREYAQSMGLSALGGGEKGYSVLERKWARPTLDCNGIYGGYSGPGSKTIIPSKASVKFSIRAVPNQDPAKLVASVQQFVRDHTPPGIVSEVQNFAANPPVTLRTDSPAMDAARSAVRECFGKDVVFVRCGASIPIAELFQRLLKVDPVMLGICLPDDNIHAPNEHLALEQIFRGAECFAAFYGHLGKKL